VERAVDDLTAMSAPANSLLPSQRDRPVELRRWAQYRAILFAALVIGLPLVGLAVSHIEQNLVGLFLLLGFPVGWVVGPNSFTVEFRSDQRRKRAASRVLVQVLPSFFVGVVSVAVSIALKFPLWPSSILAVTLVGYVGGYVARLGWVAKPGFAP
jgi:hypothetical protein